MRPRSFDYDRMREMLDDGATLRAMIRALGCTRAALYQARKRLGLPHRFPPGPPAIDDELVERLSRQGWTKREIAAELECCMKTVERSRARIARGRR